MANLAKTLSSLGKLSSSTQWNDRLTFEVALKLEGSGEAIEDILDRHNVTKADFINIANDPQFRQKVASYREEIKTRGLTFRLKAKAQAEDLLTTSWLLIHDNDVSPTVKADLIKSTVRWAGYEVKDSVDTNSSGGVSITINLGDKDPVKVIDAE